MSARRDAPGERGVRVVRGGLAGVGGRGVVPRGGRDAYRLHTARAGGGDLTLRLFGRRRNLIRQRGKFQPERYHREKKASREIQTAARVMRAPAGKHRRLRTRAVCGVSLFGTAGFHDASSRGGALGRRTTPRASVRATPRRDPRDAREHAFGASAHTPVSRARTRSHSPTTPAASPRRRRR